MRSFAKSLRVVSDESDTCRPFSITLSSSTILVEGSSKSDGESFATLRKENEHEGRVGSESRASWFREESELCE